MATLEQSDQPHANDAGRNKRSVKGLLIDRRFQLKYTLIVVFMAVTISTVLGVLLMSKVTEATQLAINSARGMAALREQLVVPTGNAASIIPEIEKGLAEAEKALMDRDREVMVYLIVCLVGLVLALTLLGIFVTHKVAGPLFVMSRYLTQIGAGNLRDVRHLRKGDELLEFFNTFERTLRALQERHRSDISTLEAALQTLRDHMERTHGQGDASTIELARAVDSLAALKKQKQEALG